MFWGVNIVIAPMRRTCALFLVLSLLLCSGFAENGADAWLRYAPLDATIASQYSQLPTTILVLGNSAPLKSAQAELLRGIQGILGRSLRLTAGVPREATIIWHRGAASQVRRRVHSGFRAAGRCLRASMGTDRRAARRGHHRCHRSGRTVRNVCTATQNCAGREHCKPLRRASSVGTASLG